MTGFRFVEDQQAEYHVVDLCRVTGVSRSSFYAWRTRKPSTRELADAELLVEIREIHQSSRCTYGAPRVWVRLRRAGHRVGRKRVARLMAADGLIGAHARRRWRRGRHPAHVPAPDLLKRDFTAERADLRWAADITEFACIDGKLFLAGIRDLHDRGLAAAKRPKPAKLATNPRLREYVRERLSGELTRPDCGGRSTDDLERVEQAALSGLSVGHRMEP